VTEQEREEIERLASHLESLPAAVHEAMGYTRAKAFRDGAETLSALRASKPAVGEEFPEAEYEAWWKYSTKETGHLVAEDAARWAWSLARSREEERVKPLAGVIKHALHNGYMGEGSTKSWAEKALAEFEKGAGDGK
jgi:hypothetical protein